MADLIPALLPLCLLLCVGIIVYLIVMHRHVARVITQSGATVAVPPSHVMAWPKPKEPLPDRLAKLIADTIAGLHSVNFKQDPLLAINQAHLFGVLLSAVARHGYLIEETIYEALRDCDRYRVWQRERFTVGTRTVEIDLIVYDTRECVIRSYEIKRGNSDSLGSHTERATRVTAQGVEPQLIAFAGQHECPARRCASHIVSYYGHTATQAIGGVTLTGHSLDEHFELQGVRASVELMTDHLKHALCLFLHEQGLWTYDTPRVGDDGGEPPPEPTPEPTPPRPPLTGAPARHHNGAAVRELILDHDTPEQSARNAARDLARFGPPPPGGYPMKSVAPVRVRVKSEK